VSTTMLTPDDEPIDHNDDIALPIAPSGDPMLGFGRVLVQVNTNAHVFRGWGPKVLI